MCGIFGVLLQRDAPVKRATVEAVMSRLYELSESRGKESAGMHAYLPSGRLAWTIKGTQPATEFLKSPSFQKAMAQALDRAFPAGAGFAAEPLVLLAHSRLVTNGTAALPQNNQPVRSGHVSVIHNGIVVNVDELWARHPQLQRHAEVDTEVLAAMLNAAAEQGADHAELTRGIYAELKGAASVAWVHDRTALVTLATNTGDIYVAMDPQARMLVFASERYILTQVLKGGEEGLPAVSAIEWLSAGHGLGFDVSGAESPRRYALTAPMQQPSGVERAVVVQGGALANTTHQDGATGAVEVVSVFNTSADESLVRYGEARVKGLRRCTCCVLPETFPYIAFDQQGVCNYCRSYRPRYAGMHPEATRKSFIESLERYRRGGTEPDVIVPFSGGRDSSYGLHLIKKEFGLRPVTFTYDWGMVTDLARRNVARLCGQLGIQNILVSADIKTKRDNIRKNVSAWLKQPDLGMVPLFMAGDKHFFRVVNELKRQTGIDLDLWCANPLENTDFKSGFCNVSPDFEKKRVDYLSLGRKARLASYYAARFLQNPRYLNSSLKDTFGAFLAYYVEPRRDFYFIFDHFIWNEDEVNRTLLGEYEWELSPDSPSTWRIGDGTAPFYNYIYMTARGFTEFDTFRSNQIREGQITREQAMASIIEENRPRIPSLRWYLDTINLDFNDTIRRINTLDTLGLHR